MGIFMQTKSSLRQYFRERRRQISPVVRAQAAQQVLSLVRNHELLNQHRTIACYLPQDGEFDITPLIHHGWQQNQTICLPSIFEEQLVFKPYKDCVRLKVGAYGTLEPDTAEVVSPDLVFLPLVAFDRLGNRLGMGKGFYDKTFQRGRSILVGVAFACQESASLPVDVWDVPLDAVVTEKEFIDL